MTYSSFGTVQPLPSRRFRAFYVLGGKRVKAPRTFPDPDSAQQWLNDEQELLARPRQAGLDLTALNTFDEWRDLFLTMPRRTERRTGNTRTSKKSPATVARYKQTLVLHCSPYLGHKRLADIDFYVVKEFVEYLERKEQLEGKPIEIRRAFDYATYVVNCARKLAAVGYVAFNDPRVVKPDGVSLRPPVEIDEADVRRLMDNMPDEYRNAIYVAAYLGLRAGELWALRVRNVSPLTRQLLVDASLNHEGKGAVLGPTKSGQVRRVEIPQPVFDAIERQIQMNKDRSPDAILFPSSEGKFTRHGNFSGRVFRPACEAAKMPEGFRFHDLRHFCAHFHIGQGWDLSAIKDLLGHSSIMITDGIYGGRFNDVRRAMAEGVAAHLAKQDV